MSTHGSLPVYTQENGDIVVKLVDTAGVNESSIDTHGSLQVKITDSSGNSLGTSGNPVYTEISGAGTSSDTPLYVNSGSGAVGTPKNSGQLVATNVAANGTDTLSASSITASATGNLMQVVCSGSGAARFDIQTVNTSDTATTIFSLFTTAASPNATFEAYTIGEISIPDADGTNAKYQVVITNNDPDALNYYVYISWMET